MTGRLPKGDVLGVALSPVSITAAAAGASTVWQRDLNVLGGANAGFAHAEEMRRVGAVICRAYPDVPTPVLDEIATPAQKIEAPLAYLAHERLSLFRACMDAKP